ncbi:MAG: sigma-70 family RNA polymerase sigma factor [Bryobacteraceae bacterium]
MRPERRIWVRPTDDQGNPVDPRLEEAAYALEQTALAYRRDELGDETCASALLEAAVHIGSRAGPRARIDNPSAYLRRIFARLVDAEIEKRCCLVSIEEVELHERFPAQDGRIEDIERSLLVEALLNRLDVHTRRIVVGRMLGESVSQIATDLGVTPDCVSQRLNRGLARLRKALHLPR